VGAPELLFYLRLVVQERFKGLIKILVDKIFDQLVVHPDDADKQRHGQGIKLGRIQFKDDLGEQLGGDIGRGFGIDDVQVIALLNQRPDLVQGQVPAVGRVVIAPIRILLDLKLPNIRRRGRCHNIRLVFAIAQRKLNNKAAHPPSR